MQETRQNDNRREQSQGNFQTGATLKEKFKKVLLSLNLGTVKDVCSIIQSIVAVFAILFAGYWFLLRGEAMPRANIRHEVTYRQISDKWTWINIGVTIENKGNIPLVLKLGDIRIQKILPLDPLISKALKENRSPISQDEFKVLWPLLDHYKAKLNVDIEPGESDRSNYEFIIPSYIRTVKIYTAFTNPEKSQLVWSESTIYDIKNQGGVK